MTEPEKLAEMRAEMAAALGMSAEEALDVDPSYVATWYTLRLDARAERERPSRLRRSANADAMPRPGG